MNTDVLFNEGFDADAERVHIGHCKCKNCDQRVYAMLDGISSHTDFQIACESTKHLWKDVTSQIVTLKEGLDRLADAKDGKSRPTTKKALRMLLSSWDSDRVVDIARPQEEENPERQMVLYDPQRAVQVCEALKQEDGHSRGAIAMRGRASTGLHCMSKLFHLAREFVWNFKGDLGSIALALGLAWAKGDIQTFNDLLGRLSTQFLFNYSIHTNMTDSPVTRTMLSAVLANTFQQHVPLALRQRIAVEMGPARELSPPVGPNGPGANTNRTGGIWIDPPHALGPFHLLQLEEKNEGDSAEQ